MSTAASSEGVLRTSEEAAVDSDDFDEATRLQDLVTAVEGRIDAELARVSKEEFQALD